MLVCVSPSAQTVDIAATMTWPEAAEIIDRCSPPSTYHMEDHPDMLLGMQIGSGPRPHSAGELQFKLFAGGRWEIRFSRKSQPNRKRRASLTAQHGSEQALPSGRWSPHAPLIVRMRACPARLEIAHLMKAEYTRGSEVNPEGSDPTFTQNGFCTLS